MEEESAFDMTMREVYKQYEHLDPILCDMVIENIKDQMLYDFWQVIKYACKQEAP